MVIVVVIVVMVVPLKLGSKNGLEENLNLASLICDLWSTFLSKLFHALSGEDFAVSLFFFSIGEGGS